MCRALPLVLLVLTGCMSRPGVVDCTTGRAYPGFSKPLCGGPFDPFVWLAGDCQTCCAGCQKCSLTPYGGHTHCGEEMRYTPSCVGPAFQIAAPAVPGSSWGRATACPPFSRPGPPGNHSEEIAPKAEGSAQAEEIAPGSENESAPGHLDARHEVPGQVVR